MNGGQVLLDDSRKLASIQPLHILQIIESQTPLSTTAPPPTLHTPNSPPPSPLPSSLPSTVLDPTRMLSLPGSSSISSSSSKAGLAPRLTKPGYVCSPSIEELRQLLDEELRSVTFSVKVRGVAKIRWLEPVDLRGLDLDRILDIGKENDIPYVDVCCDYGLDGVMEPNTGLNKKAQITFYKVLNKNEPTEDMTEFIRERTEQMGAEFVSYNPKSGKWVIRVSHF